MPLNRNLLIILAHGLRADVVLNDRPWPADVCPALRELADRGLYAVATSASPSDPGGEVSLLTGMHARQHGVLNGHGEPVGCDGWPLAMAEAGLVCHGVGLVGEFSPVLHDPVIVRPPHRGDTTGCAYLEQMRARNQIGAILSQRREAARMGVFEPERLVLDPADDIDGFIAAEAALRIERLPTGAPWAMVASFSGPGNELPPPLLYDELFELDGLGDDFAPADFTELDDMTELDYPRVVLQRLDPGRVARIRADYLGRVRLIDHGVSRMLRALSSRPDADRTWIVVASDRGQLLGEHGIVGRRSFFAPAVETPVIVVPPSPLPPDLVQQQPISTVDAAATVLALAGCDVPEETAGQSLLHLLSDEPPLTRPAGAAVLSEFGKRVMLETERFKVVFNSQSGVPLGLYDVFNDPEEHDNLVDDAKGRNVLDAVRLRLCETLLPLRSPHRQIAL